MDNQIQCLVRHILVPVLIHTFSAHGAEVRTVRTAAVLHIPVLAAFVLAAFVLTRDANLGFAADKILIRKADKVGIEKDGFHLFLRLFRAVGIDGNGLFIVGGKGHIILLHCVFPRFQHKISVGFGVCLGVKSADNQRASPLSRWGFALAIPR